MSVRSENINVYVFVVSDFDAGPNVLALNDSVLFFRIQVMNKKEGERLICECSLFYSFSQDLKEFSF